MDEDNFQLVPETLQPSKGRILLILIIAVLVLLLIISGFSLYHTANLLTETREQSREIQNQLGVAETNLQEKNLELNAVQTELDDDPPVIDFFGDTWPEKWSTVEQNLYYENELINTSLEWSSAVMLDRSIN